MYAGGRDVGDAEEVFLVSFPGDDGDKREYGGEVRDDSHDE